MRGVKMKKRYITTKNMNLIADKIILDFPALRGTPTNEPFPNSFKNPKITLEGDGTFIDITVPDTFDITQIDNIINTFIPNPIIRKTKDELISEFVTNKTKTDARAIELLKMIIGEIPPETK